MTDLDDKIDDALGAWPDARSSDEATLADKTTKRIRANFPPKTRSVLSDDDLVAAPFPAEPGEGEMTVEYRRTSRHSAETLSSRPMAAA